MNEVLRAAQDIQQFIRSQEWQFCIIGGIAVARWGQPRTTADVDVTLITGFGSEEQYVDLLLFAFSARRTDAKEFALTYRVLLLKSDLGIGIDVALAGLPFEERLIQRATEFSYGQGIALLTASAEDLVVLKAFAGRPQDWIDLEGILVRQGDRFDWELTISELEPLCALKESPETVTQLLRLRDSLKDD
jgi:hypothetical protein